MNPTGVPRFSRTALSFACIACILAAFPVGSAADTITFSGTVSYQGAYSGDTLYVVVLDTSGVEDVTILDLQAFSVGAPPFDQPYSLQFDNSAAGALVFVISFLDVDGGGVSDVGEADVFGWYNGGVSPTQISSASSQSGLDFPLPRAEIHGTLTLAPGQGEVRPNLSTDPLCRTEGFRPPAWHSVSGPYALIGYPGTFCVYARGSGPMGEVRTCFGDPTCASPTLITLTEDEVRTGVDLDFTDVVPLRPLTWGQVKSLYR
jgi:hypothetical protein